MPRYNNNLSDANAEALYHLFVANGKETNSRIDGEVFQKNDRIGLLAHSSGDGFQWDQRTGG